MAPIWLKPTTKINVTKVFKKTELLEKLGFPKNATLNKITQTNDTVLFDVTQK